MITLIWDTGFKKKLKKCLRKHPELKKPLQNKLDLFCSEPFALELNNHKLSGKLKGLRALVVEYDCRIIFKMIDNESALLVTIGTHGEVY